MPLVLPIAKVDSNQRIVGFELHGVTFIPITVFPALALMPPYSFLRAGLTAVPGMAGCLPGGATPQEQCLSESRLSDGLVAAKNAYLNPNLHLVTTELREIAGTAVVPPALPGGGTAGAGAATLGGRLYVTGGSSGGGASPRAFAYDPARNQWTAVPDMPRAVRQHCTAAAGGRLYVAGGREAALTDPLADVGSYDPATGTWIRATPLPEATADAACVGIGTGIYVFGGATAGKPASDAAWVLDTDTGRWSALPRLPIPLAGSAVAVTGRQVWIVNGTSDGLTATERVLVFSLDSGTWSDGPSTNRGVYRSSAAWLEGRLFVAGGRTSPGGALDVGSELYHRQNIQLLAGNTWHHGLHPPLPAAAMAAPGIFTNTYGETRSIAVLSETAAIATNVDGTLNYPSQPARPGETITLRVTGLGEVQPRPDRLQRGPREPAAAVRIPEVLIDGRPAPVRSAVLTPGEAGLYDVTVTIPRETRSGVRVSVQLRSGDILSNTAVLAIE